MAKFILPEALCVTADWSTAVKEDDPKAAFVLGGKGSEIEYDLAVELGLVGGVVDTVTESEEKPVVWSSHNDETGKADNTTPDIEEEIDATAGAKALASEHNINLHHLQGLINGRITKRDVQSYLDELS